MSNQLRYLLLIPLTLLYLAFLNTVIVKFNADKDYNTAQDSFEENNIANAYIKIEQAIKANPNEPAYLRERAKILIALTLNKEGTEKDSIKNLALEDLKESIKLNPNNLVSNRNATAIYYFLSVKDLNAPQSTENSNPNYSKHLETHLGKLKENYRDDLGVQILVAKHEKKLGLEDEYMNTLSNIELLRPDILEWHPDLINE